MVEKYPGISISIIDSMTYAADYSNIDDDLPGVTHYCSDIRDIRTMDKIFKDCTGIDAIFHFAAESHVDNSIDGPDIFIDTNITGTYNLLEQARKHAIKFIHISTDEVYGDLELDDTNTFTESNNLKPSSVYSASKASSDLLVRAYNRTYNIDTIITRCCNNYGPRQHLEKLIPKIITNALTYTEIPVYGKGINIREWIHVNDHCRGIEFVYNNGKSGEVYNIGSGIEYSNIELVKLILSEVAKLTGSDKTKLYKLITYVTDRKGHDLKYAINSNKLQSLGWKCSRKFNMSDTIQWYQKKNT